MDIFMEHMVQHKHTLKDVLCIAGIIAAAVVLLIVSTIISANTMMSLWPILVAVIIFFAVILIRHFYVEFEYTITNNELDIDKIIGKKNRLRIITVNFLDVDICAPVSHNKFGETEEIVKTYDCTGSGTLGVYFIDFDSEKGKVRVLFEPPVSFVESVKKYNPSRIFAE